VIAGTGEATGHFWSEDGAEVEVAGEEFAGEEDGEGEPGVDERENDREESGEEAGSGDFGKRAEAEEGAVLVWAPFLLTSRKKRASFVSESRESAEEEKGGVDEEGGGEGEGGEEGGEGVGEVPGDAFGVVVDHDAGEDGAE